MDETTQTYNQFIHSVKKDVEIDSNDVIVENLIGSGMSGKIYKGILKVKVNGFKIQKTVAIKEVDLKFTDILVDTNNRIKEETYRFKHINHPNVIKTFGICEKANKVSLIIMEYALGGSLFNFLDGLNQKINRDVFLNWSFQIASAIETLHQNDLIHCDLKAKNILLSFQPHTEEEMINVILKVSNISHFVSSGTATHMAPEAMKNRVSKKSDVWSYGVVLWEILNRKKPFEGLEPLQVLYKVGIKRETLELSEEIDPLIRNLIKKCWSYNQNDRPNFIQIRNELIKIKNTMQNDIKK